MSNQQTKTAPLTFGGIWSDDNKLRRVFSWLTRIGAAPKFGSVCIAYYQQDQCKAIADLETFAKAKGINLDACPIRFVNGRFQARTETGWTTFAMLITGTIIAR